MSKGVLVSNPEKSLMCLTTLSKSSLPRLFLRSHLLSSHRAVISPLRVINSSFKYKGLVLYLRLNKNWVLLLSIVNILAVAYNLQKKVLPLK